MKPKFIILGIVLCVLSSAPLKADPDGLDSATISGTYERRLDFQVLAREIW